MKLAIEPDDISRQRLLAEVAAARRGTKPRHWRYRVYIPVLKNLPHAFAIYATPKFDSVLLHPQDAFHRLGQWQPYYAARLADA